VLLRALRRFGTADDEFAGKLLRACRSNAPDCEVAEVVHFVEQKGTLIAQDRGVRIASPMGFLLAAVPKCFVGDAFRLYREECCRLREEVWRCEQQRQAELEQWTREQEAVLADPNASADEKRLAREVLGKNDL